MRKVSTALRIRLREMLARVAVLAAGSACLAVEATDPSLPVKLEFVEAKSVQYATRAYRRGSASRPRTIARRYALRLSIRVSNGSRDALRSVTLDGVYVGVEGELIRRSRRQLTIEPPLQPGEARVIEFEDDFGAEPPSAVKGFAGKVVDMNFAPETVTIIRDGKLHAAPNEEARVDLGLRKGTPLERLNWWRDWYQVKAPTGEIGWIHTSLLPIAVFVDDHQVAFEVPPDERDDGKFTVLLVPMANALGAEVKWHEETECIGITKGDTQLLLKRGSAEAVVNREGHEPVTVALPQPLLVRRGKSYIDLEWLCRRLGAVVKYDAVTRSVNVETEPEAPARGPVRQARGSVAVTVL